MLIFTKDMFLDDNNLNDFINNTNDYFKNSIQIQQNLKKTVLNYTQEFADSTFDIDTVCSNDILKFLENLKTSLNFCNENIEHLNSLSNAFNDLIITAKNNSLELDSILKFNSKIANLSKLVSENTLKIESFLNSILVYSKLNFGTATSSNIDTSSNYIEPDVQTKKDSFEFLENTLLVSESRGKVFLPYTIEEINKILNNNSDKYSSLYDVIEKNYTLPLNAFKNFPIARFREAFKLARVKENKSIKSAFDLGFELLFNYNLHPSIISACKNMDELDIYLDYLSNNETDKFDCFNIIFDIAPIVKTV